MKIYFSELSTLKNDVHLFCNTRVGTALRNVKKKWKSIRDRFVRELKKVKNQRSGDPGPPYKPSWSLYNLLLFLVDSVRHRP